MVTDFKDLIVYQIYPRSYYDSNGDGIGDLAGITQKLDYVASLGVNAIWISPFYTSPMDDFGYDISDYKDVDPIFGTLGDYTRLVEKAHSLDIKVIIDMVLSHTSNEHPWFKESRSGKDNSKSDWYVWTDMKDDGTTPNNWLSIFGGSAWQFDTTRRQYYMHNFLKSQPDLNLHNPEVQDALLDVCSFWLDLGTDGFRFDTANFYFCDKQLRNNPPWTDFTVTGRGTSAGTNPYAMQEHKYDKSQPENLEFFKRVRKLADSKNVCVMIGEIGDDWGLKTIEEYTSGDDKLQTSYGFDLMEPIFTGKHIFDTLLRAKEVVKEGYVCWATSNHDVERVASRWKSAGATPEQVSKIAMAILTINKGMPCFYMGEELGLTEADIAFEDLVDPYGIEFWPECKGRDGCRTPMVWKNEKNGGFGAAAKNWLPVPEEHLRSSVEELEGKENTTLSAMRELCALRNTSAAIKYGEIELESFTENKEVFKVVRKYEDDRVVFIFNLSGDTVKLPVSESDKIWVNSPFNATITSEEIVIEPFEVYIGM